VSWWRSRRSAPAAEGRPVSPLQAPDPDGAGEARPTDECPYHRPFPEDFDDCPAYAARRYVPFDSLHHPLRPIWTCNFLSPRRAANRAHGYYASCTLGDAADRLAWVESLRGERLAQVTRLQRQTAAVAEPFLAEVYAAKARQLEATGTRLGATAELEVLLRRVEAKIAEFIDDNRAEFEAAGLPADPCKEVMTLAVRAALERRHLGSVSFEPPDDLLQKFPVEIRPLLFPTAYQPD
jgi:hypothetical protein